MQSLSEQVYAAVNNIDEARISKYYQPMSWLPHITLGKKLSKEQMNKAIAAMHNFFSPFTSSIVEIGLSRVNPYEDLIRFKLKE